MPVALDTRRLVAIALAVAAVAFAGALLIGKAGAGSNSAGALPSKVTPSKAPAKVQGVTLPTSVPALRPEPHAAKPSSPTVTETPSTSPTPSAPSGGESGGGVIVG